jgi:hypothetical protein
LGKKEQKKALVMIQKFAKTFRVVNAWIDLAFLVYEDDPAKETGC